MSLLDLTVLAKTTITTQILQHEWMENAVYINPDQIAKDKFGDIYDNSVDNQEACLLFRMVNGKVYKRYVEDLPNWANTIVS